MSKCESPEWAKRLEEWGKEVEAKFDSFDKKEKKDKRKPWEKKGEYVGEIIGDVIALLLINMAPVWWPGFFTSSYSALLAVANIVILMQIAIQVVLLVYSPKWLYYLGKSGDNLLGFIPVVTAVVLFPFNVPFGLGTVFRLGLAIVSAIVFIVALVHLIKSIISVINIHPVK